MNAQRQLFDMSLLNFVFSDQIRVRIGWDQVKRREGSLEGVLGLLSSLKNILKAENMAPSHLYFHGSNHSTIIVCPIS